MAKRVTTQLVKQLICILMVAVVLAPIILVLFASFKTKADMVKISPLLLPPKSRFTLENFQKVLNNKYLLIGFKNTGIILVVSIFFNVMFGTITEMCIRDREGTFFSPGYFKVPLRLAYCIFPFPALFLQS